MCRSPFANGRGSFVVADLLPVSVLRETRREAISVDHFCENPLPPFFSGEARHAGEDQPHQSGPGSRSQGQGQGPKASELASQRAS